MQANFSPAVDRIESSRHQDRRQLRYLKLSKWIVFVAMVTGSLTWIPIAKIAGISIDMENLGRILVVSTLPILIMLKSGKLRIEPLLVIIFVWAVWNMLFMIIHTGTQGIAVIRMWVIEVVFALTIINCSREVFFSFKLFAIVSTFSLTLFIFISAQLAQVAIFDDTLTYLMTQNREMFMAKTIRPIVNAFVPASVDADEYSGVQVNKIAACYVLFLCMVIFSPVSKGKIAKCFSSFSVAIAMLALILLFSSSSMLALIFALFLLSYQMLSKSAFHTKVFIYLSVLLATSLAFVSIGHNIFEYVSSQVESDSGSRDVRLQQYLGAWMLIRDHAVIGTGYQIFDGNPIHNWPLFSWVTSGVVGFSLVLLVYFLLVLKIIRIYYRSRIDPDTNYPVYFLMSVSFLFFVRTMVGGAGGIGGGAAMVGLAVGLLIVQGRWPKTRRDSRRDSLKTGLLHRNQ